MVQRTVRKLANAASDRLVPDRLMLTDIRHRHDTMSTHFFRCSLRKYCIFSRLMIVLRRYARAIGWTGQGEDVVDNVAERARD